MTVYADNAATTRMSRTALDAMLPAMEENYGNPSSLHSVGQRAAELLMKSRETVDSYGEVLVSALKSDPTVCLVEFSFTVAHGLNRIYLTAHITV